MKKACAVSGKNFEITPEDVKFYEKAKLPLPTLCPEERNKRRMVWRNDRTFYQRKCDKTGKPIISIYPANVPFPVYEHNAWWGDGWNAFDYGQDFDFSRPFFEQFQELMNKVPRRGLDVTHCENSNYCNFCTDDKNCYLDIAGEANEDSYFNLFTKYSKNCADTTFVYNSELVYESINCYNCFDVRFSMYLENCNNCDFCFDMKGCNDCIFSWNLRQQKYCIFNEQLTKEEYEKRKVEFRPDSRAHLQKYRKKFIEMIRDHALHKNMMILNSENCSGNNLNHCKNTHYAFNASHCEDSSYLYDVLEATDCRDLNYSLYKPEMSCELTSTLNMKFCAFSMATHFSHDVYYCDHCENAAYLFGCVGLKDHPKYCIFNKQYSKEQYQALKEKIIEHMKRTGEWGEFFPGSISPHAYNETVASEYFPLSKEKALAQGFKWKEPDKKDYLPQSTTVPDSISETSDDILKEVLACKVTGKNYKIQKEELKFYQKMGVPVPDICPDQRHLERMKIRSPRKLFDRKCTECDVEIQSTIDPSRKEKVLCEKCYLAHIH